MKTVWLCTGCRRLFVWDMEELARWNLRDGEHYVPDTFDEVDRRNGRSYCPYRAELLPDVVQAALQLGGVPAVKALGYAQYEHWGAFA